MATRNYYVVLGVASSETKRSFEPQPPQRRDQFSPTNGPPGRHQLAFLTCTVAPPIAGTASPRDTRTRTHASITSASCSRHVSTDAPVATTPRSPGTERLKRCFARDLERIQAATCQLVEDRIEIN